MKKDLREVISQSVGISNLSSDALPTLIGGCRISNLRDYVGINALFIAYSILCYTSFLILNLLF